MEKVTSDSLVLMTLAAPSQDAHAFFLNKLSYETDPSDVYTDVKNGVTDFVLMDVRSHKAYQRSHAVG